MKFTWRLELTVPATEGPNRDQAIDIALAQGATCGPLQALYMQKSSGVSSPFHRVTEASEERQVNTIKMLQMCTFRNLIWLNWYIFNGINFVQKKLLNFVCSRNNKFTGY